MKFLEAQRILAEFRGGPPLAFLLAASSELHRLKPYLSAGAAVRGRAAQIDTWPFGTLGQGLIGGAARHEREIFLLTPWDFVPELDWRSGIPDGALDVDALRTHALSVRDAMAARRPARLLYLPAAVPPVLSDQTALGQLLHWLEGLVLEIGGTILPGPWFSLPSFLGDGALFAGDVLGAAALEIVEAALALEHAPGKVLVTDLDGVLWRGVVAEDGVEQIRCGPAGSGYQHFLYQTLLRRLRADGVLIAAVSRNDREMALAPFRTGAMPLRESDLVCLVASYEAKSSQIAAIAEQLNLGLDAFVFVDDNPIELAEVAARLPAVRQLPFPARVEHFPEFAGRLATLFSRSSVTVEDRNRTEMYHRRLQGMAPSRATGAELSDFLRGLGMRLVIQDLRTEDRARAVQLINKTNQFNLNGRRISTEELDRLLEAGGRAYTASLSDRTGDHGQILACIVRPDGCVQSLVLSCRVFQRRVEHAFLCWLGSHQAGPVPFDFARTERNEPMQRFMADAAFAADPTGRLYWDAKRFRREHGMASSLFELSAPSETAPALVS